MEARKDRAVSQLERLIYSAVPAIIWLSIELHAFAASIPHSLLSLLTLRGTARKNADPTVKAVTNMRSTLVANSKVSR